MIHTASRPQHGPEEGLWFVVTVAAIMALAFVAVILFVPR